MKHTWKRMLSAFLAFALVFSLVPAAQAQEHEHSELSAYGEGYDFADWDPDAHKSYGSAEPAESSSWSFASQIEIPEMEMPEIPAWVGNAGVAAIDEEAGEVVPPATEGTCGENATWSFDAETGTLTISGTGMMEEYSSENAPAWGAPYYNVITNVVVEEGITNIGSYSFAFHEVLTSITLPSTLEVIGVYAFGMCPSLESINLPDALQGILPAAFLGCSSLRSITLPEGLELIADSAFGSTGLTSVTIPASVTTLGAEAFRDMPNLTSVVMEGSPETLGDYIFTNCTALQNVDLGSNLTAVGYCMFSYCSSLQSIVIPDTVATIGEGAFAYCTSLQDVTLPANPNGSRIEASAFGGCHALTQLEIPLGIVYIGATAFAETALTHISLPESAWQLEESAFALIPTLESFEVAQSNAYAFSQDGVLYAQHYVTQELILLQYPAKKANTSYDILGGTVAIGMGAFMEADKLQTVGIPESVVYIGSFAFRNCNTLKTMLIPGSVANLGDGVFADCPNLQVFLFMGEAPASVGTGLLLNNKTTVIVPTTATTWGNVDPAYFGAALLYPANIDPATNEIVGPCGTSMLWHLAFNEGRLTFIGEGAMDDYTNTGFFPWMGFDGLITDVVVQDTVGSLSPNCLTNMVALKNVNLGNTLTTIPASMFFGCTGLETIVIPNSVTLIDQAAFMFCFSLKNVTLPSNLENGTVINSGAFFGCEALSEITFPDGIMATGPQAFCGTGLTQVSLPACTQVVYGSFVACPNLVSIEVDPSNPFFVSIDGVLFAMDENQVPVTLLQYPTGRTGSYSIPEGTVNIFYGAFGEGKLSSAAIPASVVDIGSQAFAFAKNSMDFTFAGNAPVIAADAFQGTTATIQYPVGNSTWTADVMQQYGGALTWSALVPEGYLAGGTCGANLTWLLTEDGVLTISGTGEMDNYSFAGPVSPFWAYQDVIREIVIQQTYDAYGFYTAGVNSLGDLAFHGCDKLTSIVIPAGISSIGIGTFAECTALTKVEIPDLNAVEASAFAGCLSLKEVTFHGSAPTIGEDAFQNVAATVYHPIHNSWDTVAVNHYGGALSWKEITSGSCGENVTWSFDKDTGHLTISGQGDMKNYSLGAPVSPFYLIGDKTKTIEIEDGITSIGSVMFPMCAATELTIPASVTKVHGLSFGMNYFQEITFLGNAPVVDSNLYGTDVFSGIVATVNYPVNDPTWDSFTGQNYGGTITWNPYVPEAVGGTIAETDDTWNLDAEGTLTIAPQAEAAAVAFTADTLLSDGTGRTNDVPWSQYKAAIKKVIIIPGVEKIIDNAFAACENLADVELADTITDIGAAAFQDCTAVKEIIIPESVQKIQSQAFSGCSELEKVHFEGNAPTAGENVFENVSETTSITYPENDDTWNEEAKNQVTSGTNIQAQAHTHAYGNWIVVEEATCIAFAKEERTCTGCPVKETRTGDAYGAHKLTKTDAKAATCTNTGNSDYWICATCGKFFSDETAENQVEKNSWIMAVDPEKHTGMEGWTKTVTTHKQAYTCCGAVIVAEESHEWENGSCIECGFTCKHTGGTATCIQGAPCGICGMAYGAVNPDNHAGGEAWTQTATTHKKAYACCGVVTVEEESHVWAEGYCMECGYSCKHSGGTATCTEQAICGTCSHPYGELNAEKHTGKAEWTQTATTHEKAYTCCDAVTVAEEVHEWQNGRCSECGYVCEHTGGTATCTDQAVCEICGQAYGDKNPDKHTGSADWTKTETKHKKVYTCCKVVVVAEESHEWANGICSECEYACEHTGGKATCSEQAVCTTCGEAYGELNSEKHAGKAVWAQTATEHTKAYDCCGAVVVAKEDHEWQNGRCSECGYVCEHTGSTATCTDKAVCGICGESYGEKDLNNHMEEGVWTQTESKHSQKYPCCGTISVAEEPHEWVDGICSECAYACQHTGGEASCSEQAKCATCGHPYGDTLPHTLTKTDAKSATCQETGIEEYHTCTVCGKFFSDASGNVEIQENDWIQPKDPDNHVSKEVIYIDNGNGQDHTVAYECCHGTIDPAQFHSYADGKCVCGAEEFEDREYVQIAMEVGAKATATQNGLSDAMSEDDITVKNGDIVSVSMTVSKKTSGGNSWLGGWFGNWWGGSNGKTTYDHTITFIGENAGATVVQVGDVYYKVTVTEPHVHKYTAAVTKPTCTDKGYTTYTCECGDSYVSDYVDALGHTYDDNGICGVCGESGSYVQIQLEAGKAAVASQNGLANALSNADVAVKDGSIVSVTVTAVKKTTGSGWFGWGNKKTTYDHTITFQGLKAGTTLVRVGEVDYRVTVTAPHVHAYNAVVTAPTCTDKGYTTYTCTCSDSYVSDYVDALGHDYEDGVCGNCGQQEPQKPTSFAPKSFSASISKSSVKAGESASITVKTSTDVAYVTINGQKVTTYKTTTSGWGWNKTTCRTFTYTVSEKAAGTYQYEIFAFNADGAQSDTSRTVKLTVKASSGGIGSGWWWK